MTLRSVRAPRVRESSGSVTGWTLVSSWANYNLATGGVDLTAYGYPWQRGYVIPVQAKDVMFLFMHGEHGTGHVWHPETLRELPSAEIHEARGGQTNLSSYTKIIHFHESGDVVVTLDVAYVTGIVAAKVYRPTIASSDSDANLTQLKDLSAPRLLATMGTRLAFMGGRIHDQDPRDNDLTTVGITVAVGDLVFCPSTTTFTAGQFTGTATFGFTDWASGATGYNFHLLTITGAGTLLGPSDVGYGTSPSNGWSWWRVMPSVASFQYI